MNITKRTKIINHLKWKAKKAGKEFGWDANTIREVNAANKRDDKKNSKY